MNRYETAIPRIACAVAAITLTAITIVVSVVAPAGMELEHNAPMAAKAATQVTTCHATSSARPDLVGARRPEWDAVPCTSSNPTKAPEG